MKNLLLVFLTFWLTGCWGGAFGEGADDPVETTTGFAGAGSSTDTAATGGGTTGGMTGGSGGDGSSTSSATTGAVSTGTGGSATETTTTDGSAGECEPPTDIPELFAIDVPEYEAETTCSGKPAMARCLGDPCVSFELAAIVEPWSDDGLTLRVRYPEQWLGVIPELVDCGDVAYECPAPIQIGWESSYDLELERTATGYRVASFRPASGDSSESLVQRAGGFQPSAECSTTGAGNYIQFVLPRIKNDYLNKIRSLTWECGGAL